MCRHLMFLIILIGLTQQGIGIDIPLNTRLPTFQNAEMYSMMMPYDQWSAISIFNLIDIPKDIKFLIVQAHTQFDPVVMSYGSSLSKGNYVNGTNIGLIIYPKEISSFYIMNLYSKPNQTFDMYLSVHGYYQKAPVPGGCNMEFNVKDAPYLQITHNTDIINVDAAPPDLNKKTCDLISKNASVEFYHLHSKASSNSSEFYFRDIQRMMTVENILKYGTKVSQVYGYGQMRRVFALYPDVGSTYAVIVTDGNYSAAYIPAYTFGCSLSSTCPYPKEWMIAMYFGAAIGLFICFFAHFFYKSHIILLGYLSTTFVGGLVLSAVVPEQYTIYALVCGVIGGLVWFLLWLAFPNPVVVMFLNSFCCGCLLAAIMYFSLPDYRVFFEVDMNFWWGYILVVLLCQVILMMTFHYSIMLTCSIIGAFLIIIPLDVYFGSYLRYILINMLRRTGVTNFNLAVINPPYQWKDIVSTVMWIVLTLLGFRKQVKLSMHGAPFPTHEVTLFFRYRRAPEERTRLLNNQQQVHGYGGQSFSPSAPLL